MALSLIKKTQLDPNIADLIGQYGSGFFLSIGNISDKLSGSLSGLAQVAIGYAIFEGQLTQSGVSGYISGVSGQMFTGISNYIYSGVSGLITGNYLNNSQSGLFYPKNGNPSGFITTGQTGQFFAKNQTGQLSGTFLQRSQTGLFYPANNPSGFIANCDLSVYVLKTQTGSFIVTGQTGNFYPRNNPSGFITSSSVLFTSGDQTVSGQKKFVGDVYINNLYVTGSQSIVNVDELNVESSFLLINSSGRAPESAGLFFVTGSGMTGLSDIGPILGVDGSSNFVFGYAARTGNLSSLNRIASENFVRNGFLSNYNSSVQNNLTVTGNSFLTGNLNVSGSSTFAFKPSVLGGNSLIDSSQTGSFITTSQTGIFINTGQTGSFVTTLQTGNFASASNLQSTGNYLVGQINTLSGNSVISNGTVSNISVVTQAQYNALTPNSTTLYIIVG